METEIIQKQISYIVGLMEEDPREAMKITMGAINAARDPQSRDKIVKGILSALPSVADKNVDAVDIVVTRLLKFVPTTSEQRADIVKTMLSLAPVIPEKLKHRSFNASCSINVLLDMAIGLPHLRYDIVKGAIPVLPSIAEKQSGHIKNVVIELLKAAQDMHEERDKIIKATLPLLPVIAKENVYNARHVALSLLRGTESSLQLQSDIVNAALPLLAVTDNRGWNGYDFALGLLNATDFLPKERTSVINTLAAALPVIVEEHLHDAMSIIYRLTEATEYTHEDRNTIVKTALSLLPAVAQENAQAAQDLISDLFNATRDAPEERISAIKHIVSVLPTIVEKNAISGGAVAYSLVDAAYLQPEERSGIAKKILAQLPRLGMEFCEDVDFLEKTSNYAARENTPFVSPGVARTAASPGSGRETWFIAFEGGGTKAFTGCFSGSVKELEQQARHTHGGPNGDPSSLAHYLNAAAQGQIMNEVFGGHITPDYAADLIQDVTGQKFSVLAL